MFDILGDSEQSGQVRAGLTEMCLNELDGCFSGEGLALGLRLECSLKYKLLVQLSHEI